MTIASPLNEEELRNMMYTAQLDGMGTFSIRYPRGRGVMPEWQTPFNKLEIGKGHKVKDGEDVAIISLGPIGNSAIKAAKLLVNENISVAVYDMRFLKPIDENILHEVFKKFKRIITIEDGTIIGGLGSAVLEFKNDHQYDAVVKRLGIPDQFIQHGSPEELYRECGFDVDGIIKSLREF